ncbi:MAG: DUF3524 domain-containing protein [Chitinophagales bacterium]
MKIVLIEPFYTGSHQSWAEGLKANSQHDITILSLTGKNWKWRMHGGAISLAKQFFELKERPDLILASDMLNLSTFLALTKSSSVGIPTAIYFHENQLSYPWSMTDEDVKKQRDFHYGFMNWISILSADKAFFNSQYNHDSFFREVAVMLKAMPDNKELQLIELAQSNSSILPLGIQLEDLKINVAEKDFTKPVILWNHRWEYDKNPLDFYNAIKHLQTEQIDFGLIVCGEGFEDQPEEFDKIKTEFSNELLHFGFAESRADYRALLQQANIIPVTSQQEFFGQSVMEAMAAGCFPLLPNRLAYPNHIPESLKQAFLYDSVDQLQTNLLDICKDMSAVVPLIEAAQGIAMQYDWSNIIETYDAQMENLANT